MTHILIADYQFNCSKLWSVVISVRERAPASARCFFFPAVPKWRTSVNHATVFDCKQHMTQWKRRVLLIFRQNVIHCLCQLSLAWLISTMKQMSLFHIFLYFGKHDRDKIYIILSCKRVEVKDLTFQLDVRV